MACIHFQRLPEELDLGGGLDGPKEGTPLERRRGKGLTLPSLGGAARVPEVGIVS